MPHSILTLNIGSSQLVLAEFEQLKPSGIQLTKYAVRSLGIDPGTEADTSAYVVSTIREMIRELEIKPGPVVMSVSGKDAFPRFVKLPPVTGDKVEQIVFYEAQQNVPFPISEVVWDYQLVENEDGGLSAMLVAIKTEIIRRYTDAVVAAGLEPDSVDIGPMALYNLVRYSQPEGAGCVLVVDVGARSTNLVFVENRKAFSRSIPVAGHTITQELMKEFSLGFKEAEELKLAHAVVAFSGAVETSESQIVNRVAKTVRSVMTRLHSEISRSISFYRSQQNGEKPTVILLCGGSSVIPETDTFLKEKLGLPVQYLNPFENVPVAESITVEDLTSKLHLLGEVTGLALRKVFSCPMEINLMPPDLVAKRMMKGRIPFFITTAAALLLALSCWLGYCWRLRTMGEKNLATIQTRLDALRQTQGQIEGLNLLASGVETNTASLLQLISLRTRWIEMVRDIRSCVLDGMWITEVFPYPDDSSRTVAAIEIHGMGFVDKVKDAEAVGRFGNALKNTTYFTDEPEVIKIVTPTAFTLEFALRIKLKEPLFFPGGEDGRAP